MEVKHLWDLVILSEELHFTRAAKRLHITQPALSQHISRLERMWGAPLFDRTGHRVRLTPFGQLMIVHARRILDEFDLAGEVARHAVAGNIGTMRVGLAPSVDPDWFNGALKTLHTRYPNVSVTVLEMSSPEIARLLRVNQVDIGIIWLPHDTSGLESSVLMREERLAALPPEHPLSRLDAIPMRALDNEPLVMVPRTMSPDLYDRWCSFFREAGIVPRILHESFTAESHLAMTRAGLGISILPKRYLDATQPTGVTVRPICDPTPVIDLAMLVRLNEQGQAVSSLRELLRDSATLSGPAAGGR